MSTITGGAFGLYGGQSVYGEGGWLETMNSTLKELDAFVNLSVESTILNSPPSLDINDKGKKYLIPADGYGNDGTGKLWSTYRGNIALWDGTNWVYYFPPRPDGLTIYDINTKKSYIYDASLASAYKWIEKITNATAFRIASVGQYTGLIEKEISSQTAIDTLSTDSPTSKYLIQARNVANGAYQASELMVVYYSGTSEKESLYAEYGRCVLNDTAICSFAVLPYTSEGVSVHKLYATPATGLTVYVKIMKYTIFA